jgi:protein arginine kinase
MEPNDLVISTRVRLARNIENVPFNDADIHLFEKIAKSIKTDNENYFIARANGLDNATQQALVEQHLISEDFLTNIDNGIIVTRGDNRVCIMLGEEDHIRIQATANSFDLNSTYQTAKVIANKLETNFKVARDNRWGYLTHHPSNLGSGMRASVMIYLPALTVTGEIKKVFNSLGSKITVRGVYGEGSKSSGFIYQISNQNCLLMTDDEIINMVYSAINEIARAEFNSQKKLYHNNPNKIEIANEVMTAWGILTNNLLLSSADAAKHLAWIKLGVCLDILKFKNNKIIDDLFFITKPYTLSTQLKKNLSPTERDKERAGRVKEILLTSRL